MRSLLFCQALCVLFLASTEAQTCYKTSWPQLNVNALSYYTISVPLPVYSQQYVVYIQAYNPTGDDQFGIAVFPSTQGYVLSSCLGSSQGHLPYPPPFCNLIASGPTYMNMAVPVQTIGWDSNPLIKVECLDGCFTNSKCSNICEVQLTITVCHNSTFPAISCGSSLAPGALANPCALPDPLHSDYKAPELLITEKL